MYMYITGLMDQLLTEETELFVIYKINACTVHTCTYVHTCMGK